MVESIEEFANEVVSTIGTKRSRVLNAEIEQTNPSSVLKRARTLATDALNKMPTGKRYEKSFMHRDMVSYIITSSLHGMVFTGSIDGYLKFWKKGQVGIEFIKSFRAHMFKITGMAITPN